MRNRIMLAAAGVAAVAGGTLVPAASNAGTDIGVAVPMCGRADQARLISHRDVDGDGRRDVVKAIDETDHRATIKVNFGGGSASRSVKGSFVQVLGAAPIGGMRGAELVVANNVRGGRKGSSIDARVLTYRNGKLRRLAAPTGGSAWRAHSRPMLLSGWTTHRRDGRLYVTHRTVRPSEQGRRYIGQAVSFVRRDGQWDRIGSRTLHFSNRSEAARVIGWRVPGVQYWTGC